MSNLSEAELLFAAMNRAWEVTRRRRARTYGDDETLAAMVAKAVLSQVNLTIKLMSLAVHVDEWLQTGQAEAADRIAIESLLDDSEVLAKRVEMDAMGLLPVMR